MSEMATNIHEVRKRFPKGIFRHFDKIVGCDDKDSTHAFFISTQEHLKRMYTFISYVKVILSYPPFLIGYPKFVPVCYCHEMHYLVGQTNCLFFHSAYHSGVHAFTPGCWRVRNSRSLVFCVMIRSSIKIANCVPIS